MGDTFTKLFTTIFTLLNVININAETLSTLSEAGLIKAQDVKQDAHISSQRTRIQQEAKLAELKAQLSTQSVSPTSTESTIVL